MKTSLKSKETPLARQMRARMNKRATRQLLSQLGTMKVIVMTRMIYASNTTSLLVGK